MKLNTNYVECMCFDFHRPPRLCPHCGRPPHQCTCQPCFDFCPRCNRPKNQCSCWQNASCFPQFSPQICPPFQQPCWQQPNFNYFPIQSCMPSCSCINFQIPCSLLYMYAGYMLANCKKD